MKKTICLLAILCTTFTFAQKTTIYGIGDSTMANKSKPETNPEHGWGQVLQPFLKEGVTFKNHAVNGRSSKSFITEKRWDTIYKSLKKGDYVFIQFGHNDQKDQDPTRYTNPHTAYRYNLTKFVNETREKGATPILFSSIARRNFNEKGVLIDTHGDYPLEVRLLAQELKVPFIDLQYLTEEMEKAAGVEGSKKLHLHFAAGENPFYPNGKDDDTHLSKMGAQTVAKLACDEIKNQKLSLAKLLN